MSKSPISEAEKSVPLAPQTPAPPDGPNTDPGAGNGKHKPASRASAASAGTQPKRALAQYPAGWPETKPVAPEHPAGSPETKPAAPEHPAGSPAPAPDPLAKRSEWSNWAVLAVLVLCFVLIVRFKARPAPQAFWQADEARSLEQVELVPLTPGARSVHSRDLTGRVVLISFWAASDQQAPRGISRLTRVKRALDTRGSFRLLVVCCGPSAKEDIDGLAQRARQMIDQAGVGVDAYADPGGVTRRAVDRAVGLHGYPTTLLIDRQGRVRGRWCGLPAGADEQMRRLATRLLPTDS